jgi:Uma2 family endonuclease
MTAMQEQQFPRPLKLTVDNFMALHEAGAFQGLSKVELINGEMLTMSPQHLPHVWAKSQLSFRLFDALRSLGSPLAPFIEGTVAMSDIDAPEPDIVLAAVPHRAGLIPVTSVQLVVEVADSSLRFNSKQKARLYAAHRIPEYWVLGIPTETVQQMWAPTDGLYTQTRTLRIGERIESVTIPGLVIESDGLI